MRPAANTRVLYFAVQGLNERADSIGGDLASQFRSLSDAGVRCRVFAGVHLPGLYPDLPVESSDRFAAAIHAEPGPVLYHWCDGWAGVDDLLGSAAVPVIVRWHNNTPPWFFAPYCLESTARTLRGFSSIVELARARNVSFMVNSTFSARQLAALGIAPSRTSVVPPLSAYVVDPSHLRRSTQTAVGDLRILFVGRIVPHKGQKHVIRAAHALQTGFGWRCRVVLAGRADSAMLGYVRELESLADDLDVDVRLPGEVTSQDLFALYQSSDVFVCLSEHEGFGLPVIEAMKAGLPVVGYLGSAIAELLRGHPLACSEIDDGEVAARLAALADPGVRAAVVRFQDEVLLPEFTPNRVVDRFLAALNGVVSDFRFDTTPVENGERTMDAETTTAIASALARARSRLDSAAARPTGPVAAEPPEHYVTRNDLRAYDALLRSARRERLVENLRDDWMATPFRSPIPLIGPLIDRYKRFILYSEDGLVVGLTKLHSRRIGRLEEIEAKVDGLSRRSKRDDPASRNERPEGKPRVPRSDG